MVDCTVRDFEYASLIIVPFSSYANIARTSFAASSLPPARAFISVANASSGSDVEWRWFAASLLLRLQAQTVNEGVQQMV